MDMYLAASSAEGPLLLAPEMSVAPALVRPERVGGEHWFPDFDPERDQVVVIHPDDMRGVGTKDLALIYDPIYDETEVRLVTPRGARLVCFLPDVAPEELGPAAFAFMPAGEAARHVALQAAA